MLKKSVAIFAAAASLALVASEAQAGSRFDFINKYIEKYAKVRSDNTIGNGRFNLGSAANDGLSSQTGTVSTPLSSLRNRFAK